MTKKRCGARNVNHTPYTLQKGLPPITAVCDNAEHKLDYHIDSRLRLAWGKDTNVRTDWDDKFKGLQRVEEKRLRKVGVDLIDAHKQARAYAYEQLGARP